MSDPYKFDGLDRYGECYHVFGDYVVDPKRGRESYGSGWELWAATLARARQGDFSWVPSLLDLYTRSEDYVIQELCADLLSDAAPEGTVAVIRESIARKLVRDDHYDPQFAFDMSRVLYRRMRLGDVPLLLRVYQGGVGLDDIEIVDMYMNEILGETYLAGGRANLDADSELVMARVEELTGKYGTDDIALWQGEPFSIVTFVKRAMREDDPTSPLTVRHIFEAVTGTDCRGFFRDEEYQALTAATVLEDFLHGPEAKRYEPGARYFFGHKIPD